MSKKIFTRKSIKPAVDFDDIDDEQRRDTFGRKRVEVIQCLLDSSSDESNDEFTQQITSPIVWLTFSEICHIRTVFTSSLLSNQANGSICFRCRNAIRTLMSFFSKTSFLCYICQQKFCKNCTILNFYPPLLKQSFPIRIQTLLRTTSNPIDDNQFDDENQRWKPICYDCSQVDIRFLSAHKFRTNFVLDF